MKDLRRQLIIKYLTLAFAALLFKSCLNEHNKHLKNNELLDVIKTLCLCKYTDSKTNKACEQYYKCSEIDKYYNFYYTESPDTFLIEITGQLSGTGGYNYYLVNYHSNPAKVIFYHQGYLDSLVRFNRITFIEHTEEGRIAFTYNYDKKNNRYIVKNLSSINVLITKKIKNKYLNKAYIKCE